MAELNANLARGNHRSATKRPDILEEKLGRDVKFGFAVPVWASSLRDIAGTMVQALWTRNSTRIGRSQVQIDK